jgi:hypothetical protein
MSTIGRATLQAARAASDTERMHFRRERVRIETERHEIEGTLLLPNEGFRSRTTDFLNALTDARVTWRDAAREPERHEYLALAARHVVLVVELGSLGIVDETGAAPAAPLAASTPPPA